MKKVTDNVRSLIPVAAAALIPHAVLAGTTPAAPTTGPETSAWEKANDWNIGNVLFPNVHLHGIGGYSTGDPAELATGGHDPRREDPTAQAIEPGISLRTQYLEGFANGIFFQDENGDWDSEMEEAFGKIIGLPGGFEIKGGQFLSRFGAANDRHLHGWDFVDAETVSTRFLGEHGLLLRGAEVSWTLPLGMDPTFLTIASVGYGEMRPHEHDHGGHDEHASEALFEGEEGVLSDNIWTARLMGRYRFSDFHTLTGGLSWAGGDNGFGRGTDVAGVDLEYLWRENGLESGGRAFRWRNEFLWRRVGATSAGHDHADEHGHDDDHAEDDHHDEHGEEHADEHHDEEEHEEIASGTYEETGLYSTAVFTWNAHLDTGLRVGWVEGIDAFGQEERLRISPNVTWWFDEGRRIGTRLQYNYDQIGGGDDEHSVWFQVNIALGSTNEVR